MPAAKGSARTLLGPIYNFIVSEQEETEEGNEENV